MGVSSLSPVHARTDPLPLIQYHHLTGLEQKRLQARLEVSESEDFVSQAAKEADTARGAQSEIIKELLRAREEQLAIERRMAEAVVG